MALPDDGNIFEVDWVGDDALFEVLLAAPPPLPDPFDGEEDDDVDAAAAAAADDDDAVTVDTFEFVIIFLKIYLFLAVLFFDIFGIYAFKLRVCLLFFLMAACFLLDQYIRIRSKRKFFDFSNSRLRNSTL